jgi:hypothetical protein
MPNDDIKINKHKNLTNLLEYKFMYSTRHFALKTLFMYYMYRSILYFEAYICLILNLAILLIFRHNFDTIK